MNITDRLLKLDPSLEIHNEGRWKDEFDPTIRGFASFNDAGVECETGEFLYAMVRILKPLNILETGTHHGVGASYMAMGAKDNGFGLVTTIEFIKVHFDTACERFRKLGITEYMQPVLGDVQSFQSPHKYQLVLLDTEPITRFGELVKFYDQVEPGGYIFIHDTPRSLCQGNVNPDHPEILSWPFGDIPQKMRELVKNGALRPFHFPTPRGLIGFYKTHLGDLIW